MELLNSIARRDPFRLMFAPLLGLRAVARAARGEN